MARALRRVYGHPRHHNRRDPLAELIFILLSTQTREAEYRRTFAGLRKRFPIWEQVRTADPEELEGLLRVGGFARRKTALLQAILDRVKRDRGTLSLRWLAERPTAEALEYLESLPGVGPKTARCVLAYAFDRPVLAVDTHVWRIAQRLGWVSGPKHPDRRRSERLEASISPRLRHALHVTMVAHGREVCRARPACATCCLRSMCPGVR